jgi:hypothetical protein
MSLLRHILNMERVYQQWEIIVMDLSMVQIQHPLRGEDVDDFPALNDLDPHPSTLYHLHPMMNDHF